jgi:CheY-like chemotaxis protein
MTTCLIVDDTPLNVKLHVAVLEKQDYDIKTAVTAEQALDLLASYSPTLLLVDVRLPKMNGLSLVKLIRAEPRHKGMVIVAVTASAMKGDEQTALAAGCDAYVTKPIDTRALPALLVRLLAKPTKA